MIWDEASAGLGMGQSTPQFMCSLFQLCDSSPVDTRDSSDRDSVYSAVICSCAEEAGWRAEGRGKGLSEVLSFCFPLDNKGLEETLKVPQFDVSTVY